MRRSTVSLVRSAALKFNFTQKNAKNRNVFGVLTTSNRGMSDKREIDEGLISVNDTKISPIPLKSDELDLSAIRISLHEIHSMVKNMDSSPIQNAAKIEALKNNINNEKLLTQTGLSMYTTPFKKNEMGDIAPKAVGTTSWSFGSLLHMPQNLMESIIFSQTQKSGLGSVLMSIEHSNKTNHTNRSNINNNNEKHADIRANNTTSGGTSTYYSYATSFASFVYSNLKVNTLILLGGTYAYYDTHERMTLAGFPQCAPILDNVFNKIQESKVNLANYVQPNMDNLEEKKKLFTNKKGKNNNDNNNNNNNNSNNSLFYTKLLEIGFTVISAIAVIAVFFIFYNYISDTAIGKCLNFLNKSASKMFDAVDGIVFQSSLYEYLPKISMEPMRSSATAGMASQMAGGTAGAAGVGVAIMIESDRVEMLPSIDVTDVMDNITHDFSDTSFNVNVNVNQIDFFSSIS